MINLHTKYYLFGLGLLLIIILPSCIDEFWPELDNKYENLLVVDGNITDGPGPYTVNLSLSSSVDYSMYIPAVDYQVVIKDDQQNEELLLQTYPGTYSTAGTGLQGVVGRKYKLLITAPSGKYYESEFAMLKSSIGIDSIYYEIQDQENEPLYENNNGFQFYVDTDMTDEDTSFFFWRLTETYEYNADYLIRWKYGPVLERVYNSDTLYTCWKTEKIHQIFTYTTANLNEPRIEYFPLHYISTETRHLSIRYSLLMKQYSIDRSAYTYWNDVSEIQEQDGLYTRQPFQVNGNLKCISDPEDVVLGYFMVAGVSEKRVFFDRPLYVDFNYFKCTLTVADYMAMEWLFMTPSSSWPLYVTEGDNHAKAFPHQNCIDCTRKGGSILKPDFWSEYE